MLVHKKKLREHKSIKLKSIIDYLYLENMIEDNKTWFEIKSQVIHKMTNIKVINKSEKDLVLKRLYQLYTLHFKNNEKNLTEQEPLFS